MLGKVTTKTPLVMKKCNREMLSIHGPRNIIELSDDVMMMSYIVCRSLRVLMMAGW